MGLLGSASSRRDRPPHRRPRHARLWVIEAKIPEEGVAVHHVLQHVQRFGRYRDKLLAKTAAAAHLCGAPDPLTAATLATTSDPLPGWNGPERPATPVSR